MICCILKLDTILFDGPYEKDIPIWKNWMHPECHTLIQK